MVRRIKRLQEGRGVIHDERKREQELAESSRDFIGADGGGRAYGSDLW